MNVELPEHLFEAVNYEVWPEHVDVVKMFLRCQTQWRSGPNGVLGLDYGVVLQLCGLYAVENRAQLLDDLQIMECHALQLIAEAAEKQQKASRRKAKR
jgi:hypothetical protein